MNDMIAEVAEKAGIARKVLQDEQTIVAQDEWTPERETLAQALLDKDQKVVPEFWQGC